MIRLIFDILVDDDWWYAGIVSHTMRYSEGRQKGNDRSPVLFGFARKKKLRSFNQSFLCGGRGIRTPGDREASTVFKTAAFDHSAIPPKGIHIAFQ